MKIYTKTGDKGETGLWGGGRISKDDVRLHAYGTVDECNSIIGIARTSSANDMLDPMLDEIQNHLFLVGSDLATPGDKTAAISRIQPVMAIMLEKWIDDLEAKLPPLKQFILPGGTPMAAYLHLARTVCRRAERWLVTLVRQDAVHNEALVYLNRLSDFLFVAARAANLGAGKPDIPWKNPRR